MTEAARESSVHAPLAAASLVGGDWPRGGDAVEVFSASDLDEIVTVGVHAPLTAVDNAVGAARSAAGTWSRVTPAYRADVLRRAHAGSTAADAQSKRPARRARALRPPLSHARARRGRGW
jgi:delta 1-pyrroline-5-carboxylate dehydrogenase